MPPTDSAQRLCPHCGAKVDLLWTSCWMCGLDLPSEEQPVRTSVPQMPAEPSFVTRAAGFVPWLLGGLIVLMLIGMCANGDWGAAIGFAVLLSPPAVYTVVKSAQRQEKGDPMTRGAKFGTFILSLAVTIGCIFAVGFAAFVALFIFCIAALSTSNWH